MLILLSENEQGISALYLHTHIFLSGSLLMKRTFPWMQRHDVNYYKGGGGGISSEEKRREKAFTHPRYHKFFFICKSFGGKSF